MTGDELSDSLQTQLLAMTAQKDGAYLERNRCVALIARMALATGWRAGIARTAIQGWSEDWHGCVYVDLPTGQCSWHFHDSQAHLFEGLPAYTGAWDGHDTPEKYRRVDAALVGDAQPIRPWDIRRLDLKPGDVVVLDCEARLASEQREQLKAYVEQYLQGFKVLVLDGGMGMQVLRPGGQQIGEGCDGSH